MKKRLNKIPINYSVELTQQEVTNLSETLSAVRTAGGGTGGVYIGDGQYIGVDNTNDRISFLPDAATKLESVSDKLDKSTYAVDSATFLTALQSLSGYYQKTETSSNTQLSTEFEKYQTVAGMAEYLTTSNAQTTYLTKSSAEENLAPISVTADVEVLKANSGNLSQYYKKTDTSSKEELSAEFNKYQTKADMDSYATDQDVVNLQTNMEALISTKQPKLTFGYNENNAISSINDSALAGQGGTTYTPGQYIDITNNEISVTGVLALDEYAQYEPVLIGDSNITATSSKIDKHTQWNLAINSTPVVTDTKLVGENSITAHTTNVSGEWLVGLEQTAHNAIASIDGISTDVGTLKTASANWNEVSSKLDSSVASTTYQTKADMEGYLTKNEASTTYQPTGNYLVAEDITGKLDKSIYSNASGNWENTYNTVNQYSAAGTWLTQQSLTNYYQKTETSSNTEITNALNTKVDKPTSMQTGKLVYDGDTSAWISMPAGTTTIVQGTNGISAEYDNVNTYTVGLSASYKAQIEAVSSKLNKADADTYYAPLSITATVNTLTAASAGWNDKVDKPTALTNKYLVLRTDSNGDVSGWCDFQDKSYSKTEADRTFVATANIDTTTLSGDGKSVSTKLGVKTDVIATIDYVSDNYLPTSGGTVSGQLVVSGDSNFDTENLKFIRTGQNGYGRIGLASDGALALKVDNGSGDTLQINMSTEGSTGYGNINVNNHGNQSKVVNVPTASYNSMSSFDNTNGPNYMLRKTASGFDIGAAVINVQSLPAQTEANAYYFVYDA